MNFDINVNALSVSFNSAVMSDPYPTNAGILKQMILTGAESLLFPVLQRDRIAHPKVKKEEADAIRPMVTSPVYVPKDFNKPRPISLKGPRKQDSPNDLRKSSDSTNRPVIAPDFDLRAFTSLVNSPRSLKGIDAKKTYEFWYVRDPHPVLRHVRFSKEVLEWMVQNPTRARLILTALNLGDYRGQMSGIKPLKARSRRYDGPIYEIKAYGRYRALLLFHKKTWEVICVSHKDDVTRDAEWLTPLN